jgi:hypothetical protein
MVTYAENHLYHLDEDDPYHKKERETSRSMLQTHLENTMYMLQYSSINVDRGRDFKRLDRIINKIPNPYFGEVIFKAGFYLYTGYFTSGAEQWLNRSSSNWRSSKQTKKLGEPRDGWTEEHWIPRTTVGKIAMDALLYNKDDYKVFDGDCSIENVCSWIEKNIHLFCSVIISSKDENDKLDKLIDDNHFTFEQLLNLEHYKELGITLDRNKHLFKKYLKPRLAKRYKAEQDDISLRKQKWSFVVKDDSHFFPQIITPAMKELAID